MGTSATVRFIEGVRLIRCPLNTGLTVSGFSFACNKCPPQFTDDKRNDSSIRKESHWMCLIDLEGDTNYTIQNQSAVKGQKLGLCL